MKSAHTGRAVRTAAFGGGGALLTLWLTPALATPYDPAWWALSGLATALWLASLVRLAHHVARPLDTASNLLRALTDGDYSLRVRSEPGGSSLLALELNRLAAQLASQRRQSTEATHLLRAVMDSITAAVVTFDERDAVVLCNPAAARLFGSSVEALRRENAASLGLSLRADATEERLDRDLPGALGPFDLCIQPLRHRGRRHTLVVVNPVAELLHREARRAQSRILAVTSHEINNSLAPLQSLAGRLQRLVHGLRPAASDGAAGGAPAAPRGLDDLQAGLEAIERRAAHLGRVMREYGRLARVPAPRCAPLDVRRWLDKSLALWPAVVCTPCHTAPSVHADEALLDQVLTNLVKNALEASHLQRGAEPPAVHVHCEATDRFVHVRVEDRGPGLPEGVDPFLPFVSTKPTGSGIGLSLSREIVQSHGGRLTLRNRTDVGGCEARLTLPRCDPAPEPSRSEATSAGGSADAGPIARRASAPAEPTT